MHRDIKKNKAKLYETLRRIQGATLLTWKNFKPVLTTTECEETISLGATTEIHLLISSRYYTWFVFPPISPLSSWVHRLPCANFIQAYQGKVPKEKQKALMKQEEENKVTGSNLEISSRLRGRSMVSKNSKMKNIFHFPFLKHMHFSTMQNYLTREIKVLLRETKITGSNTKNPNSICGIAFVPRPFLFSAGGTEGKRRESKRYYKKKKKKKRGGDIRDEMHFRLCATWLKWSKIQLAAFEHMTLQRQAVNSVSVEGNEQLCSVLKLLRNEVSFILEDGQKAQINEQPTSYHFYHNSNTHPKAGCY